MKIDREHVKKTFAAYVQQYNSQDDKTRLKIVHTYRVSELCETLAKSIGLAKTDVELAWLLGMLHDLGRFEQLRQFGTFDDAASIDHAAKGADILFLEGRIREYGMDASEDALIETAIRAHNAYRIPQKLDSRTETLCHILRDADKIDILRVNVDFPLEEIYNVSREELAQAAITPAVLESFYEEHATLRSLKRTPVDHVVSHISLVFELVYPLSASIVHEQGYLERLLQFKSDNPDTAKQIAAIREYMAEYFRRRQNAANKRQNN